MTCAVTFSVVVQHDPPATLLAFAIFLKQLISRRVGNLLNSEEKYKTLFPLRTLSRVYEYLFKSVYVHSSKSSVMSYSNMYKS